MINSAGYSSMLKHVKLLLQEKLIRNVIGFPHPSLQALLPDDTPSYRITEFRLKDSSVSPSEQHFVGEIRLAIKEAETAKQWVKKFEESSNVTLRIRATDPPSERKQHALKVYYRCQHNTRPVSATADHQRGSKNTSCPALMTLTVKSQLGKSSKYV